MEKSTKPIYWSKFLIPASLKTLPVRKQNESPQSNRKSLLCTYLTKSFYEEDIKNLKFSYTEANTPTKNEYGLKLHFRVEHAPITANKHVKIRLTLFKLKKNTLGFTLFPKEPL